MAPENCVSALQYNPICLKASPSIKSLFFEGHKNGYEVFFSVGYAEFFPDILSVRLDCFFGDMEDSADIFR